MIWYPWELIREAYKHRPAIIAHLRGQTLEGYVDAWTLIGVDFRTFVIIVVLHLLLSLWALILLLRHVNELPIWAQVVAGALLFLNLPIGTIAVILIMTG